MGFFWVLENLKVAETIPRTEKIMDENPALKKQWTSLIPQGKMGQPEDLMGAVRIAPSSQRLASSKKDPGDLSSFRCVWLCHWSGSPSRRRVYGDLRTSKEVRYAVLDSDVEGCAAWIPDG